MDRLVISDDPTTPLVAMLESTSHGNPEYLLSMHMPGHANNNAITPKLNDLL